MSKIKILIQYGTEEIEDPIEIQHNNDFLNEEDIYNILQKKLNLLKKDIKWVVYYNDRLDGWSIIDEINVQENKNINLLIMKTDSIINISSINYEKIINENIFKINELLNNYSNKKQSIEIKNSEFQEQNSSNIISNEQYLNSINNESSKSLNKINNNEKEENIIYVLTGNPLVELIENKKIPLKTMFDFYKITDTIANVIKKSDLKIKVKFLPLTRKNLEMSKDAKIIHLICKTRYKNNNEQSSLGLLFENDYISDIIFEEDLINIFSQMAEKEKESILFNNTTIIISTQFAEDTFIMFKNVFQKLEKYKNIKFKNIIVQHTIFANIKLISKFNEYFYKNLFDFQNIKEAFDDSLKKIILYSTEINDIQNCCCFHSHKKTCEFKKNLISDNYEESHFKHIKYKCKHYNCEFTIHKTQCDNRTQICKNENSCCCKKKKIHFIDNIFKTKFNKEDVKFDNTSSINDAGNELSKHYNKLSLVVGRNELLYNIFTYILELKNKKQKNFIINIFNYCESDKNDSNFCDSLINFLEIEDKLQENTCMNNLNIKRSKIFNDEDEIKLELNLFNIIICLKDLEKKLINLFTSENLTKTKIILITSKKCQNINFSNEKLMNSIHVISKDVQLASEIFPNLAIKYYNLENLTEDDIYYQYLFEKEKISKSKDDFTRDIKIEVDKKKYNLGCSLFNSQLDIKETNKYKLFFIFHNNLTGWYYSELIYILNEIEKEDIEEHLNTNEKYIEKIDNKFKNKTKYQKREDKFNEKFEKKKNKILQEDKILKCSENLFEFYFTIFRLLIKIAYKLDQNEKKFFLKPNFSLTSFSSIQQFGIWFPSKQNKTLIQNDIISLISENNEPYINKISKDELIKYFEHLKGNFEKFLKEFKDHYFKFCVKNEEIWENIEKNIEDISSTYPTCIKIFINYDSFKEILNFRDLLKKILQYKESKRIKICLIRLELFSKMNFEFGHNDDNYLEHLKKIYEDFNEINCIDGQCETIFAIYTVKLKEFKKNNFPKDEREESLINYRSKYKKEKFEQNIRYELDKLFENIRATENEIRSNLFIGIFKNKVNYFFFKYKIKGKIMTLKDYANSQIKQMLNVFQRNGYTFYILKIFCLISEFHLLIYFSAKENSKSEIKKKYTEYFYFVRYLSILYNPGFFKNYKEKKLENRYKIKFIQAEKNKNEDIKKAISHLCDKYNIDYKEEVIFDKNYYYYYLD